MEQFVITVALFCVCTLHPWKPYLPPAIDLFGCHHGSIKVSFITTVTEGCSVMPIGEVCHTLRAGWKHRNPVVSRVRWLAFVQLEACFVTLSSGSALCLHTAESWHNAEPAVSFSVLKIWEFPAVILSFRATNNVVHYFTCHILLSFYSTTCWFLIALWDMQRTTENLFHMYSSGRDAGQNLEISEIELSLHSWETIYAQLPW